MKKNDLSAKFNESLANALAEGFSPCLTELRGSYSGVFGSQLVLAKGNERMVMWMEEHKDYRNEDVPDTVSLYVSHFSLGRGETTELNYMWPNQWKEHLVDEMVVYEVSGRRNGWYVEDEDEAIRAKQIHRSRYGNRYRSRNFRELEVTDQLLGIARRLKGFKTIRRENLKVVKNHKHWLFINKVSKREVCVGA